MAAINILKITTVEEEDCLWETLLNSTIHSDLEKSERQILPSIHFILKVIICLIIK